MTLEYPGGPDVITTVLMRGRRGVRVRGDVRWKRRSEQRGAQAKACGRPEKLEPPLEPLQERSSAR